MPETSVGTVRNGFSWLYLLPLAHFCACLWIKFTDAAWMPIVFADTPISVLLLPLAWRLDYPMFWFGVLGTLWWCLLSYKAQAWIRNRRGYS
jgi:hypothetical protein